MAATGRAQPSQSSSSAEARKNPPPDSSFSRRSSPSSSEPSGTSIRRKAPPPPPPTAPLFSELAQEARDLFSAGFSLAHSLSFSTTPAAVASQAEGGESGSSSAAGALSRLPVALTATATAVQQQLLGVACASLPVLRGAAVGQLSLSSAGQLQASLCAPSVAPGLSCTAAGQWPVPRASALALSASQLTASSAALAALSAPPGMATASSALPLTHGVGGHFRWRDCLALSAALHGAGVPVLGGSVALSGLKGGVSVGGDVLLHPQEGGVAVPAATVGISCCDGPVTAVALLNARSMDEVDIKWSTQVDERTLLGVHMRRLLRSPQAEHMALALQHQADERTTVKARVDGRGCLWGMLQRRIDGLGVASVCLAMDVARESDSSEKQQPLGLPKVGFSLAVAV